MNILIKGMEMPTSLVLFCVHPDGRVFADLEGGWREYKAVPVPPHGRLIDADALISRVTDEKGNYYGHDCAVIGEAVEFAPTIIPAEEGE